MRTAAIVLLSGLAACSRGNVSGQVIDRDGKPISGVKVNILGNTTKSDAKGRFTIKGLKGMPDKRVVAYFYKDGYFDYEAGQSVVEGSVYMKVALTPRSEAASLDTSTDNTMTYDTLTANVPGGAFVNPRDGSRVSGAVKVYVGTMNPDRGNFAEAMPGRDFAARDGNAGVLTSAGAFVIEAEDENGDPVEIQDPFEACLDIPASMLAVAPETLPLWSLQDGTWVETAVATRVGDQYCFQIENSGSLNCDLFSRTAAVQGTVCDRDGEPVGAGEPVRVFQNTTYTDENGQYAALVPSCYNFIARNKLTELQVPGIPAGMTRVVDFNCPSEEDGMMGDTGYSSYTNTPASGGDADPFASAAGGAGQNNSGGSRDNDPFANTATSSRTAREALAESEPEPVIPENETWSEWTWRHMSAIGDSIVGSIRSFVSVRPVARGDSGMWWGGDTGNQWDSGGAGGGASSGNGFAGPDDVCNSGNDPMVMQAAGSAGQISCDGVSEAGDDNPFSRTVSLDSTTGSITLRYDHYGVPDRTIVSYEGTAIIDTGCASDRGNLTGSYSGQSNFVTVAVIPGCGDPSNAGTSWDFTLGCN